MITDLLKAIWTETAQRMAVRDKKKRRSKIAGLFNATYAFKEEYIENGKQLCHTRSNKPAWAFNGHAWMCPMCNKIHFSLSWSVFSGLQYPACCKYPEGHRLFEDWIK